MRVHPMVPYFHWLKGHLNGVTRWDQDSSKDAKGERGKGRVLGRWSRQMSFKKILSRVEREHHLGGVTRKSRGKGFGMEGCRSVVRAWKGIQNPPQQRCQNFIAQVVGWENPNPTTKWWQIWEHLTTVTLGRYSRHFRDDRITSMGEYWWP